MQSAITAANVIAMLSENIKRRASGTATVTVDSAAVRLKNERNYNYSELRKYALNYMFVKFADKALSRAHEHAHSRPRLLFSAIKATYRDTASSVLHYKVFKSRHFFSLASKAVSRPRVRSSDG